MVRKTNRNTARNKFALLILAAIFGLSLAFEATAQTKKKVNPRRTRATAKTRPVPQVQPLEPAVISRAEDEFQSETAPTSPAVNRTPATTETAAEPPTNSTVKPPPAIDANAGDRSLNDLKELTLAEERAETVRRQLTENIEKEGALRAKLEQVEYQMRPENIQMETAVIGSTRPEEVREARRKQLENEKKRANEQLTQILAAKTRLEAAVTNADALVDKLRVRVDANAAKPEAKIAVPDADPPDDNEENDDEISQLS